MVSILTNTLALSDIVYCSPVQEQLSNTATLALTQEEFELEQKNKTK